MAKYGRIKRVRAKVRRGPLKATGMSIGVKVYRLTGERRQMLYGAEACVGKAYQARSRFPYRKGARVVPQRCGFGHGRTPQSAIAKAVVKLGHGIASRGRK